MTSFVNTFTNTISSEGRAQLLTARAQTFITLRNLKIDNVEDAVNSDDPRVVEAKNQAFAALLISAPVPKEKEEAPTA